MSSYVVARYENMITGERVSVGLFAWSDGGPVCWRRLREPSRVQAAPGSMDSLLERWLEAQADVKTMEAMYESIASTSSPYSSISFSEPRDSALSVEELSESAAEDVLVGLSGL